MAGPALKSSRPTHVPASSTTSPNFEHRHRKRQAFDKKVEEPVLPVECAPHRGAAERRLPALPGQLDSIRIYTMGTFVTAKMAGRRVLILEKIRRCADSRRSRPRSMPASARHGERGRARAPQSALCRPPRTRPAAIPMPAFGRIGDRHTLREHRRQVLRYIMTSFGPATGFFRSMCRHKRPARWIGRPAGARSLTIKSKSRSSDCTAR
jgi:hypothetical protein